MLLIVFACLKLATTILVFHHFPTPYPSCSHLSPYVSPSFLIPSLTILSSTRLVVSLIRFTPFARQNLEERAVRLQDFHLSRPGAFRTPNFDPSPRQQHGSNLQPKHPSCHVVLIAQVQSGIQVLQTLLRARTQSSHAKPRPPHRKNTISCT